MTDRHHEDIYKYFLIFFIAVMGIVYTFPLTEGDFYWHANTGKWILENGRLPEFDPFSYTTGAIDPATQQGKSSLAVLKGYWLGQIALYLIWLLLSEAGIVALRAAIYTFILAFTARWAYRTAGAFPALILTILQAGVLCFFPNERPQLFAYLFFPVLLYLLEMIRENDPFPRIAYTAPLLCLIWGNTHGSYLLAAVIIAIYLGVELLRVIKGKMSPARIGILFASFLATFANPVSFSMIWLVMPQRQASTQMILEQLSPLKIAIYQKNYLLPYWGFLLLIIIGMAVAARQKRLQPVHLLVVGVLAFISFTGVRYIAFALLTAPLCARYIPNNLPQQGKVAITLIALSLAMPGAMKLQPLGFHAKSHFPSDAVTFINRYRPEHNIFNYYDWGGYLALFSPDYKVFTDGRLLDPRKKEFYDHLADGSRSIDFLNGYAVNTVLFPVFDSLGNRFQLPYNLLKSPEWFPVFSDDTAVIFLKKTAVNQPLIERFAIPKTVTIDNP